MKKILGRKMGKKRFCAVIICSVLVTVLGLGLILYPKATDVDYALSQIKIGGLKINSGAAANASEDDVQVPDGTVCKLIIPEIGLETNVLEGTSQDVLKKGPGHYEETPLPGEEGNCAIAGHRTMHGHPFRHIDQLDQGDEIIVFTPDGKYVYRVIDKKVVEPTDLSVIESGEEAQLTLTACHPVGSARQRLVVIAELEED
jgi:LPXTG-site transpeptidase (sortase) family protein